MARNAAVSEQNFYKNLGQRIRQYRLMRGRSQSDLARVVGVTFQQFQKYENGTNRIPVDTLDQVSKSLQFSLLEFVHQEKASHPSWNDNMSPAAAKDFATLARLWAKMDDAKLRKMVINMVKNLTAGL